jgi:hypothetical protein
MMPLRAANEQMATLVPNARFFVAKDSGHDIHQDQPELAAEAIRQVVAGVHSPDTWYDLRLAARNSYFFAQSVMSEADIRLSTRY